MARHTQTRDRLVQTAAELFWRRGYAGTGVSEIMRRAKATSGSFYHFFPTKEDLLIAVLDATGGKIDREVLGTAEEMEGGCRERLAALVRAYRDRTLPDALDYGLPVGALAAELSTQHENARGRVAETLGRMVETIAAWLADAAGGAVPPAELRRAATLVVASLEGAGQMALATGNVEALDDCEAYLERLVRELTAVGREPELEMPLSEASQSEAVDWKAW